MGVEKLDQALISIITPVYNSESFLRQCIDSILEQTYTNWELICVDDGSTDDSYNILEKYCSMESRMRVIRKKNEGKGAASARNLGYAHSNGKYVMFLDSDDFFESDMLMTIAERLKSTDADVVIFGANRFDNRTHTVERPYGSINLSLAPNKSVFSYHDCPDYIFQIGDNVTWNKLYKKSLLEEYNLRFEPIPISDDQYVPSLALVFAQKLTVIDQAFINYRCNIGTSQVDTYHLHPQSAYLASYSIVDRMKEAGIYDEVKKSYLNITVRLLRDYYDKMSCVEDLEKQHDIYIQEVLPRFEAENLEKGYFYDDRLDSWYQMMIHTEFKQILFAAARSHGSERTTEILRFIFPYDKVKRGERVVLIGKGVAGRYWYSQILLSGYCEVVDWLNDENELTENLKYDRILYAK